MNWSIYDDFIKRELIDDGAYNDITTNSIIAENSKSTAEIISKDNGIIAGIGIFNRTFELLEDASSEFNISDGDLVTKGQVIGNVHGNTRSLLSGERTALNLLQMLSGIATTTYNLNKKLAGTGVKLLDTRKTTPGMRLLEKYAVKIGGGFNHRFGLSDGILIKDNHIDAARSIKNAVHLAKENSSFVRKIEVETETIDEVKEAIEAKADIIMLDNMDANTIKAAVQLIDKKALIEVSGNITYENIREKAIPGVDYISSGMLTHSFKVLDISMKNLRNEN